MRPRVVVLLDVRGDEPPELRGRPALAYPHALRLEAAEPPLHDHVVDPAGLSVHALADAVAHEEPLVGGRVENRPLVGVEDRGRAVRGERLLDAGADARRAAPELLEDLAAGGVGHLEAGLVDDAHSELAVVAL